MCDSPDDQAAAAKPDEPNPAAVRWLLAFWISLVIAVPIIYVVGFWGLLLLPILFILWALCTFQAMRRRSGYRVWLWLAAPVVVLPIYSAGSAFIGYWTGTACLQHAVIGEQVIVEPGAANLDRNYRCFSAVDGTQAPLYPFTGLPNNLMLGGMCALLGPVRGTYHGAYPTQQEALEALNRSGVEVAEDAFQQGMLSTASGTIELSDSVMRQLTAMAGAHGRPNLGRYDGGSMVVAQYAPGCVLAEFNARFGILIACIDIEHQQVFARYVVHEKVSRT